VDFHVFDRYNYSRIMFWRFNNVLHGYVDSYMESDIDSSRITTRYVFTIGGTKVSCISKLKKVVALSTRETNYVVAIETSEEMIQLQGFMEELEKKQENRRLYNDIHSGINLAHSTLTHVFPKTKGLKNQGSSKVD